MGLLRTENISASPTQVMADKGLYFTAVNPTPGTGLATIAALTALADTSPFIMIIAGAHPVTLDMLKLTCTAPGTAGSAVRFAVKTDDAKAAPTGGSQLTPQNVNHGGGQAVTAAVYAGALVAAAAVNPRLLHHSLIRPVIPVIGDEYVINFGAEEPSPIESLALAGTAIAAVTIPAPPVIIQPGKVAQLHIWLPSQSAASSWEVDLRFYEYPN